MYICVYIIKSIAVITRMIAHSFHDYMTIYIETEINTLYITLYIYIYIYIYYTYICITLVLIFFRSEHTVCFFRPNSSSI